MPLIDFGRLNLPIEVNKLLKIHYIEVYFCQQSEFGDSADSSNS